MVDFIILRSCELQGAKLDTMFRSMDSVPWASLAFQKEVIRAISGFILHAERSFLSWVELDDPM